MKCLRPELENLRAIVNRIPNRATIKLRLSHYRAASRFNKKSIYSYNGIIRERRAKAG